MNIEENDRSGLTCTNCDATVAGSIDPHCPVCQRDIETQTGEIVQFSNEARESSDGLGGAIEILAVEGSIVSFLCRCPGGAFGLSVHGDLVWKEDWRYVTAINIDGRKVTINNIPIDVDTGRPTSRA